MKRKGELSEESTITKKIKKAQSQKTPTKKEVQTKKLSKPTTEKAVKASKEPKASKAPKATHTPTKKVLVKTDKVPKEKVLMEKAPKPPAEQTEKLAKPQTQQTKNAPQTAAKKAPKRPMEKALKKPTKKEPKEPMLKLPMSSTTPKVPIENATKESTEKVGKEPSEKVAKETTRKMQMLPKPLKVQSEKAAMAKSTKVVSLVKPVAKKVPTEKTPTKQIEKKKSDQQQTRKALNIPLKTQEKKVTTTPVKKVEPTKKVSVTNISAPKKAMTETTEKAVSKKGSKKVTAKRVQTKAMTKKKVTQTKNTMTTTKKRHRNKTMTSDEETDGDYEESYESRVESKTTIKRAKTEKGQPLMVVKSGKECQSEEEDISKKPDKYTNRCRAQSLVEVMTNLSAQQKRAVREIGFGGLLHMKITVVPSGLVDLLIEAFDHNSCKVKVSDAKEFVLSHFDVHDMFLLPMEGKDVELTTTGRSSQTEDILLKQKWRKKFNVAGNQNINLNLVSNWFTNNKGACGDEFKQVFVLYALSTFLSPTPNYSVDFKLLKAVDDVKKIKQYNWSKYVLKKLAEGIKVLKKGGKCLCGCIVVLIFAYIHRVKFNGEIQPCELPLIKHWSDTKLLRRVKDEAKLGYLGEGEMTETDYPICQHLDVPFKDLDQDEDEDEEVVCHKDNQGREYILMEKLPGIETDSELKEKALDDTHLMLLMIKRDSNLIHQTIVHRLKVFKSKQTGKSPLKLVYRSYTDDVVRKAESLKRMANDFPSFKSSKVSKKLESCPTQKIQKRTDLEKSDSLVSNGLNNLKGEHHHMEDLIVEDEIEDDEEGYDEKREDEHIDDEEGDDKESDEDEGDDKESDDEGDDGGAEKEGGVDGAEKEGYQEGDIEEDDDEEEDDEEEANKEDEEKVKIHDEEERDDEEADEEEGKEGRDEDDEEASGEDKTDDADDDASGQSDEKPTSEEDEEASGKDEKEDADEEASEQGDDNPTSEAVEEASGEDDKKDVDDDASGHGDGKPTSKGDKEASAKDENEDADEEASCQGDDSPTITNLITMEESIPFVSMSDFEDEEVKEIESASSLLKLAILSCKEDDIRHSYIAKHILPFQS